MKVREARDKYLADNGFDVAGYTADTFRISYVPFDFKNSEGRKRAIPLHDLHHVATGFGTDFTGEAEIGAWELRAGCNSAATYVLNGSAALFGMIIAPLRVIRAFRKARGATSLYKLDARADELLELPVEELRAKLGVPAAGLADRPVGKAA